jgi:WhiB family redox-sensing transcriptional regulator
MPKPYWTDDADCLGYPLEPFFGTLEDPLTAKEAKQAKTICGACPVQRDCLISAFRDDEKYGIWAGFTAVERRRMLKDSDKDWRVVIMKWDMWMEGRTG